MAFLTYFRFSVWILLRAVELLMLLRAVLSFFPFSERLYDLLFTVTEPIIAPARLLFDKMGWSTPIPLDLPFFLTFLLVSVLEMVVM